MGKKSKELFIMSDVENDDQREETMTKQKEHQRHCDTYKHKNTNIRLAKVGITPTL